MADEITIPLKDIADFIGATEAKTFDEVKNAISDRFVLKEKAHQDPKVTEMVTGKIMGAQQTQLMQTLKEYGVDTTSEDFKKGEKNIDLFNLGLKNIVGHLKNEIETHKKNAGTGNDELIKQKEAELEKVRVKLRETDAAWKLTGEEFEKYKTKTASDLKGNDIKWSLTKEKDKVKFKQGMKEVEKAGYEAKVNERLRFDLDEQNALYVTNDKGERLKSPNKAGEFLQPFEALQQLADELELSEKNPHGGKPAPAGWLGQQAQKQPLPANGQQPQQTPVFGKNNFKTHPRADK